MPNKEEFRKGIGQQMEKISSPEEKIKYLMDLAFQKESLTEAEKEGLLEYLKSFFFPLTEEGSLDEEKFGERIKAYGNVLGGTYTACHDLRNRVNEAAEEAPGLMQNPAGGEKGSFKYNLYAGLAADENAQYLFKKDSLSELLDQEILAKNEKEQRALLKAYPELSPGSFRSLISMLFGEDLKKRGQEESEKIREDFQELSEKAEPYRQLKNDLLSSSSLKKEIRDLRFDEEENKIDGELYQKFQKKLREPEAPEKRIGFLMDWAYVRKNLPPSEKMTVEKCIREYFSPMKESGEKDEEKTQERLKEYAMFLSASYSNYAALKSEFGKDETVENLQKEIRDANGGTIPEDLMRDIEDNIALRIALSSNEKAKVMFKKDSLAEILPEEVFESDFWKDLEKFPAQKEAKELHPDLGIYEAELVKETQKILEKEIHTEKIHLEDLAGPEKKKPEARESEYVKLEPGPEKENPEVEQVKFKNLLEKEQKEQKKEDPKERPDRKKEEPKKDGPQEEEIEPKKKKNKAK